MRIRVRGDRPRKRVPATATKNRRKAPDAPAAIGRSSARVENASASSTIGEARQARARVARARARTADGRRGIAAARRRLTARPRARAFRLKSEPPAAEHRGPAPVGVPARPDAQGHVRGQARRTVPRRSTRPRSPPPPRRAPTPSAAVARAHHRRAPRIPPAPPPARLHSANMLQPNKDNRRKNSIIFHFDVMGVPPAGMGPHLGSVSLGCAGLRRRDGAALRRCDIHADRPFI